MRTRHICILCTTCTFIHMTVFNVLLKYYVQCLGNIVWGVQWHTQHLFYILWILSWQHLITPFCILFTPFCIIWHCLPFLSRLLWAESGRPVLVLILDCNMLWSSIPNYTIIVTYKVEQCSHPSVLCVDWCWIWKHAYIVLTALTTILIPRLPCMCAIWPLNLLQGHHSQ